MKKLGENGQRIKYKDSDKAKPPIRDGWIELAPGDEVMIDERLGENWHQQGEKVKELRGRVLAVCIQIELTIDSLIRSLFFPEQILKIDHTKTDLKVSDLSLLFLYEVVKGLRFSDKCRIFKKLTTQHKLLENKGYKALLIKLDKVRKARNLFAHSAISFVPVGDPPNQTLRAEGYSEGKRIAINEKYIAHCEKLFSETMQLLETLQRKITKVEQNEK